MYKYEFKLKQITPMIHFQYYEKGATLRSTEVKPKLDKFLWYCIKEKRELADIKYLINDLENEYLKNKEIILLRQGEDKLPKSLYDTDDIEKNAFQYSLRIFTKGEADIQLQINEMYFGNLGENTKKKKTVLYKQPINCEIIANSKRLIYLIKKILPAFFLLHNFGTRQNKGFGGFEVDDKYDRVKQIEKYSKYDFLYIEGTNIPKFSYPNVKMDVAKWIYDLMKGGINNNGVYEKGFIAIYFLNKKIGNEKAFIKRKILGYPSTRQVSNEDKIAKSNSLSFKNEFVRALLGITDNYSYMYEEYRKIGKKVINVLSYKNEIERYSSPLLIKILDKSILFIPTDDGKSIEGKKFYFELDNAKYMNENNSLEVPNLSNLKFSVNRKFIEDFLYEFCEYFKKTITAKYKSKKKFRNNNDKITFEEVCKSKIYYKNKEEII